MIFSMQMRVRIDDMMIFSMQMDMNLKKYHILIEKKKGKERFARDQRKKSLLRGRITL